MLNLALGLEMAVAATLGALGPVGLVRPRLVPAASLVCCAVGVLFAVVVLAAGAAPIERQFSLGLPGSGMHVGLDAVSGFFLLLLYLVGAVVSGAAVTGEDLPLAFSPWLGALALTLLAADGFTLTFGVAASIAAGFAALPMPPRVTGVRLSLGLSLFGLLALIAAFGLLAASGQGEGDLGFAALRARPPEEGRAGLIFLLALAAAGPAVGLAPLHVWLPSAVAAAPSPIAAMISAAATKIALYVLLRLIFDFLGPVQPAWWGLPLLLLGAVSAVLGMLRATMEDDLRTISACASFGATGMMAIGLGVALTARANDLTTVAALALGGTFLLAMTDALVQVVLLLGAGAVQVCAGTRRLGRLGGLIHRMPLTTMAVLVGAGSLATLPPSAGFAARWTLLQALMAAPRVGGLGISFVMTATVTALGLAMGLAAVAAVRLIGIGWLGRPRTPRAAAAHEPRQPVPAAMLAASMVIIMIGLFPAAVLALARPAIVLLVGSDLSDRIGTLAIRAHTEAQGYAAPGIALLLILALALVWGVMRRRTVQGHRLGPIWNGGFAAPPLWLPFGEPRTQYSGASFSQILRRLLGSVLLGARETWDVPAPGETRPARITVALADPAMNWLARPIIRLRRRLALWIEQMHRCDTRSALAIMTGVVVLLLAVAALLERG